MFDLFFSFDSREGVTECFEVDEAFAVVLVGETGDEMALMLVDAFVNVAGQADVERGGSAGHYVDVVGFHTDILDG